MDAALGLGLALPAAGAFIFSFADGACGMPIANGLVALIEKGVVWDVVVLDILVDLAKGPGDERVDLDNVVLLIELDDGNLLATTALGPAATSQDGLDAKLGVGTLERLNLGRHIIQLGLTVVELLAINVLELLGALGAVGLEDMHLELGILLLDTVDEIVRLLEVVESIEEDKVDLGRFRPVLLNLGQHVNGDETSQAKGGGLVDVGEEDLDEAKDLDGAHLLKLIIEELQVGWGQVDEGGGGGNSLGFGILIIGG